MIAGANGVQLRRKQPWRTRKLVKTLWIIGKFSKVDHIAFWKRVPLGYVLGRSTNTIELHILEDILQALKNVTLCLFSPRNLTRRHNVKRLGVTVWLMNFWEPYLTWCSYMWVCCLGVCVCLYVLVSACINVLRKQVHRHSKGWWTLGLHTWKREGGVGARITTSQIGHLQLLIIITVQLLELWSTDFLRQKVISLFA